MTHFGQDGVHFSVSSPSLPAEIGEASVVELAIEGFTGLGSNNYTWGKVIIVLVKPQVVIAEAAGVACSSYLLGRWGCECGAVGSVSFRCGLFLRFSYFRFRFFVCLYIFLFPMRYVT